MDTLIILGLVAVFLGLIGSIVPALPGPFLSFLGILFLFFSRSGEVSFAVLFAFGLGMGLLILLGYLGPIIGAKYLGASKKGIVGAVIGGLAGLLFFPPLGIFLGALLGAYLAEIYAGRKNQEAMKSAAGVLAGSAFVLVLQVVYSLFTFVYFVVKLF